MSKPLMNYTEPPAPLANLFTDLRAVLRKHESAGVVCVRTQEGLVGGLSVLSNDVAPWSILTERRNRNGIDQMEFASDEVRAKFPDQSKFSQAVVDTMMMLNGMVAVLEARLDETARLRDTIQEHLAGLIDTKEASA